MFRRITAVAIMVMLTVTMVFAGGNKETTEASSSGRPVLRVAMECGYAPYNWTQPTLIGILLFLLFFPELLTVQLPVSQLHRKDFRWWTSQVLIITLPSSVS